MAALGSLYIVWATDGDIVIYNKEKAPRSTSSQSGHSEQPEPQRGRSSTPQYSPTRITQETEKFPRLSSDPHALGPTLTVTDTAREHSPDEHIEQVPLRTDTAKTESNAGRRKVRNWFERAGIAMSDAAHREFDVSDFRDQKARRYPWIPGEELKNKDIHRTSTNYEKNRAASYASSIRSAREAEGSLTPPAETSPQPDPNPDAITVAPRRRSTLEVPPLIHHSPKPSQGEWPR
jgi:hypothetical protein